MDGPIVNAPLRPDVSATSITEETIKAEVRALSFFYSSGMQALNMNSGAGASQNSNVSVAVTTGNITR